MSLRDALLADPVPRDYNLPILRDHSFTRAPSGWNMGAASGFLFTVAIWVCLTGHRIYAASSSFYFVTVPNSAETNKSFAGSRIPFAYYDNTNRSDVRYQQVYAASQFSSLPPGGAIISHLFLRAGCGSRNAAFFSGKANLSVRFSTTKRGPGQLSSIFAENVGADDALVFSDKSYTVEAELSQCQAKPEDLRFPIYCLDAPFLYDPSKGNLLLDLRVPVGALRKSELAGFAMRSEVAGAGDTVSRISGPGLNATNANQGDGLGLVTEFFFAAFPPVIHFQVISPPSAPTGVAIGWTVQPRSAKLQFASDIGSVISWQDYPIPPQESGDSRGLFIPTADLKNRQFFRVFVPPDFPKLSNLEASESFLDSNTE